MDSADQLSVLEVDCFDFPPAKCVMTEGRYRIHDRVHYSTKILILFAECFWILGLEQEEDDVIGEREGAVARHILEENAQEALSKEFDPYERRWDGFLALESDPLTRMRVLVAQLRASIALGNELAELEPFTAAGNDPF
ncbi:MAG: hypothetical protein ACLP6E_03630 [Acidimicrobiales bacterium]